MPTIAQLGSRSKIIAELHWPASSKVLYANPPDYAEMNAWKGLLRPGDLFLDIGANIGAYSILACETGAEVISVEPNPAAVLRLKQNLALNGYSAEIHQVALSDEPGDVLMNLSRGTEASISQEGQRVAATTIDRIVNGRTIRGMKLDVEGFEERLLRGARTILSEGRISVIQVEWNDACEVNLSVTRQPLYDFLRSYGFALYRPLENGCWTRVKDAHYGSDVFAFQKPGSEKLLRSS